MKAEPKHRRQVRRQALLAALIVCLYGGIFLASVWDDPLVRAPQLDGAEMVATARAIATGTLPPEPFYRSMGYPWMLSMLGGNGTAESYGRLGAVFGLLGHLLNAALVGLLASHFWKHATPGIFAASLYGLYPVALFFSVQLFDITWGITAFLTSIYALVRLREQPGWRWVLLAGLTLGLAVVIRPHFLFVLPVLIGAAFLSGTKIRRVGLAALALGAFMVPLGIQSWAGWRVSGQWAALPWQGAYNLYAANREGANGKYFVQSTVLKDRPEGMNPARAESEARYAFETGPTAPFEIDAMSAHWKSRFAHSVLADPLDWLKLLSRKCYYSFNNFEQYNNLSYSFHKERWTILRWNPLGWGILLLGATLALSANRISKAEFMPWTLIVLGYTASLVLFYASARFRLPLAPLMAVFAGGLTCLPESLAGGRRSQKVTRMVLIALAVGSISFTGFFEAKERSTHIQDALLVGNAATTIGNDALALEMADRSLTLDDSRDDARRLALVSYWNLRLTGVAAWALYGDWSDAFAAWIEGHRFNSPDPALATALGTVLWKTGREEIARQIWTDAAARHPDQGAVLNQLLAATDSANQQPVDPALRRLLDSPPPTS